jgi:hypothetical protein
MKFTSQNKQLTFDLFRSSLEELDKTNRWVMLGDLLPWAEIEKRYNSKLNNQVKGAGNKPARLIIGAMIIKHKLNLGDEETIQMIQENPYMQYMCGLPEYTTKPVFDPSLFVTIRKRMDWLMMDFSIERHFLKGKNLLVEISAHDLLNENTGFSRKYDATSLTNTYNNTLGRYAMLSVKYRFATKKK